MTVQSTNNRWQYDTNGTTGPWTVGAYFLADGDLAVTHTDSDGVDTLLALNVGYTVTGAGDASGGTVTTTYAYVAGGFVTVVNDPQPLQETDYVETDAFPAATHERALDRLTMLVQRLISRVDRTLRLGDSEDAVSVMPSPQDRALKTQTFDADGRPVYTTPAAGTAEALAAALLDPDDGGASMVFFRQLGTGAVARSLEARLWETISVKDYGAVGDGTDATTAFNYARDYAQSVAGSERGVRIYVPQGIYVLTAPVEFSEHWIGLFGDGPSLTVLRTASATAELIKLEGPASASVLEFSIQHMKLDCSNSNVTAGKMIELVNATGCWLNNLKIDNWWDGIYELGCNRVFHTDIIMSANGRLSGQGNNAVSLVGAATPGHASDIHFSNLQVLPNTGGASINFVRAMLLRGIDGVYIVNSHVIGGDYGITISPTATSGEDYAASLMVSNTYFDTTEVGAHVVFNGGASTYLDFKFLGCFFRDSANDGIQFANLTSVPSHIVFSGCMWKGNHGSGIKADEATFPPEIVNINGGIFSDNNIDGGAADGDILVRGESWQIVGSSFVGGDAAGVAVDFRNEALNCRLAAVDMRQSTAGLMVRNTGTGTLLAMVDGFVLKNQGSATVTGPATSTTVTHGLGVTPTAHDILLVPTSNPTNVTHFWVSGITSTQFVINVDAAPAIAASFSWKVDSED